VNEPIAVVGVVGAGVMGAGIAQAALESGLGVVINDVDRSALERARGRVRDGLARRASRLDLDADSIEAWVEGRIGGLHEVDTAEAVAREADLVIEAAPEDLDLKRAVIRTLDAAAPPHTILATNTSALSVARIAEASAHASRVLGLHFFNPVPLLSLVEVVVAPLTDPRVADRAIEFVSALGKTPVRVTDSPGFIVNRVNRPFTLEALAWLASAETSTESIDEAMRAAGYPLGPFELMDLTGLDVTTMASRAIFAAAVAAGDPRADRFRPSRIQEAMVEEGRLGRKVGHGFYEYSNSDGLGGITVAPDPVIAERINLAIINEAYAALGDGVATADDIDRAMRLGARHPLGPFERAMELGGPAAIVEALRRLADAGPRFEPASALVDAILP
jgi:3-hydroxybutyryl-CoA dehydrogenase